MKKQTFALLPHRGVARITSVEWTLADLGGADKLREVESHSGSTGSCTQTGAALMETANVGMP